MSVVAVLGDAGAVKADAGKEALVAGVAEQFRTHLPVGGCLSRATYGTGGGRGVSADLELVFKQSLHAAVVNGDEDEISGLTADLEAPRATRHANKDRCAPAMICLAGDHALPVLSAEDEGALDHAWDDGDTSGLLKDVHGDGVVFRCHDLVENGLGGIHTILQIAARGCRECAACGYKT